MSLRTIMISGASLLGALLVPTLAMAASGYTTGSVNMRTGPGTQYPVITAVPRGSRLEIVGCLAGYSWCDVEWRGWHGWASSRYLQYSSRNQRYDLPDYGRRSGVPIISFGFGYSDRRLGDRLFLQDRNDQIELRLCPPGRLCDARGNPIPRTSDEYDRYGGPE